MTLDVIRSVVNLNNVPVPGFMRNGTFLRERSVDTFIQYRASMLDANEERGFKVEFPCTFDTILISDPAQGTKYDFKVTTPEGFIWNITIPTTGVQNFGTTRIIAFPDFVLDAGYRVSILPSNALAGIAIFARLAFNIDIQGF